MNTHSSPQPAAAHNNSHQRQTPSNPTLIQGIITTTRKGMGFVDNPADAENDIVIEAGNLNTALHGDLVQVSLFPKRKSGNKDFEQTGEVIKILERARTEFVGTVESERGLVFVTPDERKSYTDFVVPADKTLGAVNGDKVVVKLISWTDAKKSPQGEIVRVIGKKGINDVEMEAIVLESGFDTRYPAPVIEEAEKLAQTQIPIPQNEIARRRDMRNVLTVTIDPIDAKDFDDAISFVETGTKTSDGLDIYEIGVHIADVSHYVQEGTALDEEAQARGCSIYLVDRTIPMLPEVLSNGLCSLNPHEDKLTFSAVFMMDIRGRVHDRWFGRTVINSNRRFTYEEAQECLETKAGDFAKELITLNTIAKELQKEKFNKGAIEFEQDEIKFKLDETGKPIGVYKKVRKDAHKLVEEYMLLANREVAKFIYSEIKRKGHKDTGSIYRIHDVPDKDRIADLGIFVRALGYSLNTDKEITAHDLKKLLKQIEGTQHEDLIRTATIRSMQKAIYSTKNIGHFGLAFDYYTHFTSPIRRYPDLLVQRILHKHLAGEPFGDRDAVRFESIAQKSTRREIDAADAERTSIKLKQVEFMAQHIGKKFTGTISGVTEWGIYIEDVDTRCEGMVKIRDLGDDFYEFNKKTYSITGKKSGKKYTLGDKVTYTVVAANLETRTLDYKI